MRLLNINREEIQETDIDLSKGKLYVTRIIKADALPIDNVKKFAYEDDDYEDVQIYERIPDAVLNQRKIDELKQKLTATDYVVLKIYEGVATREEYADILAERETWRAEINKLEREVPNDNL